MRSNIKRILISTILAGTIWFNVSTGKDVAEAEEEPPLSNVVIYEYGVPFFNKESIVTTQKCLSQKSEETDELHENIRKLEDENMELLAEIERLNSEIKTSKSRIVRKVQEVPSAPFSVEATAYTARCEGCSGITKTGYDVRNTIYHGDNRVIAVDPSVIPLHSTVKVTLGDGSTFVAKALDTGGAIKGKRIDVLFATKEETRRFGRQAAGIEIVTEGER